MKNNNIILINDVPGEGLFLNMTNGGRIEGRKIEDYTLYDERLLICDGCSGSFDAVQTDETVHVVTGDKSGNIRYIKISNWEKPEEYIITSVSEENIVFSDFKLFSYENSLMLIYIATAKKRNVLCYQMIEADVKRPVGVDEVRNKNEVFFTGDNKSISVYYYGAEKDLFGKKIFDIDKKKWSEFMPIFVKQEFMSSVYVLEDEEKTHFCYKKGENLLYGTYENGKRTYNEKILTKQHTNNSYPPILTKSNGIKLFWKNKNIVFYSEKAQDSEGWSKIQEDNLKTDLCMRRNNRSNSAEYDLFYMSDRELKFYSGKEIAGKKKEQKMIIENKSNRREEIESKKKEIMKQLGIAESSDSFDFELNENIENAEPHIFSSANEKYSSQAFNLKKSNENEILNELKKINKNLNFLLCYTQKKMKTQKNKKLKH